jgi:hypothetical protein
MAVLISKGYLIPVESENTSLEKSREEKKREEKRRVEPPFDGSSSPNSPLDEKPAVPEPPAVSEDPNNPTDVDILNDRDTVIGWILLDGSTVFSDGRTGKATLKKVEGQKARTYFSESGEAYRTVDHVHV